MMTTYTFISLVAVLLAGLLAGLFYAYDCSVIAGLGRLNDAAYLKAFQAINRAILNPYFFLSFMGSLIALPLAAIICYRQEGGTMAFYCMLAAALVYVLAVFGVTMLGNVPLNTMLDQQDLEQANPELLQQLRQRFEGRWNALHHLRTYAAMLSFVLSLLSFIKRA